MKLRTVSWLAVESNDRRGSPDPVVFDSSHARRTFGPSSDGVGGPSPIERRTSTSRSELGYRTFARYQYIIHILI